MSWMSCQPAARFAWWCRRQSGAYFSERRRFGLRTERGVRAAAVAAGLPPGTTSDALRHHCASVLLDAGESVYAVAERLTYITVIYDSRLADLGTCTVTCENTRQRW